MNTDWSISFSKDKTKLLYKYTFRFQKQRLGIVNYALKLGTKHNFNWCGIIRFKNANNPWTKYDNKCTKTDNKQKRVCIGKMRNKKAKYKTVLTTEKSYEASQKSDAQVKWHIVTEP